MEEAKRIFKIKQEKVKVSRTHGGRDTCSLFPPCSFVCFMTFPGGQMKLLQLLPGGVGRRDEALKL